MQRHRTDFSKFAKPQKDVYKKLLPYILRDKKQLFVYVLCLGISSITMFLPSIITAPLVDSLIAVKKSNMLSQAASILIKNLSLLGIIALTEFVSNWASNFLSLKISQRTTNLLRKDLFGRLKFLPVRYFDSHSHGELMSRFTNDMESISDTLATSLPNFISNILLLTGTSVAMLYLSPTLTLITCLILPIMLKITATIMKHSRNAFREQQKNLGQLNGFIEEMMEGQKEIKSFCYEDITIQKFNTYNENFYKSASKAQIFSGIVIPITFGSNNITYAIIATVGAVLILSNHLTIGKLTAFLHLASHFGRPVADLSGQLATVQSAFAGAERIFDVIEQPMENFVENTNIISDSCHIAFEDVSFGYSPEKQVLHKVSFSAEVGDIIALVGSTGAGKTTIANLITRFYDVDSGDIKINGESIKSLSLKDLRSSIGMVLQDTHLFEGTIMENIRYGRLDATDEECIEAAKLSNAHSFIEHLPNGYETVIYEDGQNLSQGQRQLLNIARVAVSQPKILVLDEATSSIDTRTEELIENGMNKLMNGRTTFIIAHRLSTIKNANTILVIENGQIIENGSHNDLIQKHGRYYQLCSGQYELT